MSGPTLLALLLAEVAPPATFPPPDRTALANPPEATSLVTGDALATRDKALAVPPGKGEPPGQPFRAQDGSSRMEHPDSLEDLSKFLNGRTLFLEKNYLGWNAPAIGPDTYRGNTPLLIEAWIAPHLALFDGLYNLDRARDTPVQGVQHHFALFVTPEFRLRMIKNGGSGIYSSPVRPMSFNPRVEAFEYFIWRVRWRAIWEHLNDGRAFDQPGGVVVLAPRVTVFGHHSNGQEHCRFGAEAGLDGNADPLCTPPMAGAPASTVNFRSGDFSTDYFGGGLSAAYYTLDNGGFEHRKTAAGLTYRYNPVWSKLPGSMNDEEAALYGQHSVHFDLESQNFIHGYYDPAAGTSSPSSGGLAPSIDSWWEGKLRVAGSVSYFWTTGAGVPSYLASLEVSHALFRLGGAGLFFRYSRGRDYLNILFVEPAISTAQFGLVFDQEPLFEYHAPASPN